MFYMNYILFFLILFCIFDKSLLKEEASDEKLLFVLEHFRHGARGPYKSFNYNEWKDFLNEEWKGAGELTQLGMRQHYLLGYSVRNKYKNFISKEFNQNEIFIISTDVNRTLMSVYSNLLGMYPNYTNINKKGYIKNNNYSNIINNKIFEEEKLKTIFPIHIFDAKDLSYQLYRTEVCPGFETFIKKISESEGMKNILINIFEKTNENYGKYLSQFIDQNIIDKRDYKSYFKVLKNLCDTFIADYFDGRDIKDLSKTGINLEEFYDHCLNVSLITVYYSYYGIPLERSVEFDISHTFREIFEYMDKRILLDKENDSDKIISSSPKFVIISGHDVSLAAFDLFFENKFNIKYKRADYANNQIFELWKKGDKYYLKYLINLGISGEFEYYEFKKEVLKDLYTDEEIRKICNVDKYVTFNQLYSNKIKMINIIVISIVFALLFFLIFLKIKRKSSFNIIRYKIIEMKNI